MVPEEDVIRAECGDDGCPLNITQRESFHSLPEGHAVWRRVPLADLHAGVAARTALTVWTARARIAAAGLGWPQVQQRSLRPRRPGRQVQYGHVTDEIPEPGRPLGLEKEGGGTDGLCLYSCVRVLPPYSRILLS